MLKPTKVTWGFFLFLVQTLKEDPVIQSDAVTYQS